MNYKLLITIIALVVFSIIIACLWTGIAMREVTVEEHPYEAGLAYEATQKRYAELGWKIITPESVNKDGHVSVSVYDKKGAALDNAVVELTLNRIGSHEIKKYRAERSGNGKYGVRAAFSSKGVWELRVQVTQGNDAMSYDRKIHIDE